MLPSPWSTIRHKACSSVTHQLILTLSTPPPCNYCKYSSLSYSTPYYNSSSPPTPPDKPPTPPSPSSLKEIPTTPNLLYNHPHANGHSTEDLKPNGLAQNGASAHPPKLIIEKHLPPKTIKSTTRIFHGKSFDSRVEALKYIFTSSHVIDLIKRDDITPSQVNKLVAVSLKYNLFDVHLVVLQCIDFYGRRGDVDEVMRGVAMLRARGVPISNKELDEIERAQTIGYVHKKMKLRADVLRGWMQIGDPEMVKYAYGKMVCDTVKAHPGLDGYDELLRFFGDCGDGETCSKLLSDMSELGLTKAKRFTRDAPDGASHRPSTELDAHRFKELLRYHAHYKDDVACARLLEEMQKRAMEDEEARKIVATIDEPNKGVRKYTPKASRNTTQLHQNGHLYADTKTNYQAQHISSTHSPTSFTRSSSSRSLKSSPASPPNSSHQSLPPAHKSELEIGKAKWKAMKAAGISPSEDFYTSLLRAASQEGDCETCDALLAAIDASGLVRSATVYAYMIDAHISNYVRTEELFNEMRAQGVLPTNATYNLMLWLFCAQRRITDAIALFVELQDMADTSSYNTLIRAYVGDGNMMSVMELSSQMKARGVPHDVTTYTLLIELFGRFGGKGAMVVDAVVSEMEANSVHPDVVLYDTLLDIYGRQGFWEKCEKLWKDLKARNVVLGAGSCARFLEIHCRQDPNLYLKWKKEFCDLLPP